MSEPRIILASLPFFCQKNYHNWWKFDEVLTISILQFFETRCRTVILFHRIGSFLLSCDLFLRTLVERWR